MADFYLDADVPVALAPELEYRVHIARTTQDLGLRHAPDDEHLLLAAEQHWIFVTCGELGQITPIGIMGRATGEFCYRREPEQGFSTARGVISSEGQTVTTEAIICDLVQLLAQ